MPSIPQLSNAELLHRFNTTRSSEAFREMVSRYSSFVLATARRHTADDWHAAEDIAQQVFAALAQEAQQVRGETLGAWLYRRTCFLAANHKRQERRREARERAAVAIPAEETASQGLPEGFDEAFRKLREEDQQVLLSRYVEEMDYRSLGHMLGISEDAAQKRTTRALEALRGLLARGGVAFGADALSGVLLTWTSKSSVPASLQAQWCESALRSAKSASWSLAGLTVPALCLAIGASVPLAIMRRAVTPKPSAAAPLVDVNSAGRNSVNLPPAPPANVDLPGLIELAKKGQDSPLWMARMDRTVNGLNSEECAALMAALGYREDYSSKRPPEIIRKKVAKHWCEVNPREAAVRLNLRERESAYRIIGAENLTEAEQMIAALPKEDAKMEFVDYSSAQGSLWREALSGLAEKDLAAALEQVDQGADRLGLKYRGSLRSGVIRDAAASNPEETVRLVGKMPDQTYLAEAFASLAKTKARLAWDLLQEFPVDTAQRTGVEEAIFDTLLKQDAKEAARLAPAILGGRAVRQANFVAMVLYQDGFEAAWATAEKSQSAEFREAIQARLGTIFAAEKPAEAMAKFSNRDANPAVRQVWWSAFIKLAHTDLTAALAQKLDSSTPPSNQLQNVANAMARKDSDAALQWLADLPDSFKAEATKCVTSISLMPQTQDPKLRVQTVMAKPDVSSRCLALTPTMKSWYETEHTEARKFAENLTGEERSSAFCGLLQAMRPDVDASVGVAKPMLNELAKSNPALTDTACYAITQFIQKWVKQEPEQASEWINALPRGKVFDHAARGIAEGLRLTDPRDALTWVTAIADDKLRDGMASWILQDWGMADSDDARAAVEALSVPPPVKAAFLKHIRPTQ